MTMRKVSQRIPFTPSKTQAALLEQCFGARRFAYNQQVAAFNTYDGESNTTPAYPNVTDIKNRPTIGDSLLNMGSRWIQTYRLNLSKPSSQESRDFNNGSVNLLLQ